MNRERLDAEEAMHNLYGCAFLVEAVEHSLHEGMPNDRDLYALYMLADEIRGNLAIIETALEAGA